MTYASSLFLDEALGFSLDLSHAGMPEAYAVAMAPQIAAAFASMKALEAGAIANPDEKRMVGHYWLRAPSLAPDAALRDAIIATRDRIVAFAKAVHEGAIHPEKAPKFTHVLVVGIGGSALGPQFVAKALGRGPADKMESAFFDNTDPDGFDVVLRRLGENLASTLTIVISKSGGTKETRNGMLEAARAYKERGLDFSKHAVAITQDGSELDKHAVAQQWIERFPMWDWVGGRTSELSAVGLLPAALQGIDVLSILDGAAAMDVVTRADTLEANPSMRLALAWHHATKGRGAKDMVILPYKDRLELFSRYLQQLVMESLGKEHDLSGAVVNQGIAVYGNKGSTDQHAYVQQLRDGVANFFITFIEVLKERDGERFDVEPDVTAGDYLFGFLEGTRRAMSDKGRRSLTITVDRVDAHAIGMLIALYERAVGFYGSLVNVNAYHQPGVEAGKKAAAEVLALQAKAIPALRNSGEALTAAELAARIGADEEVLWRMLRRLSSNPNRGVARVSGTGLDSRYRAG